MNIQTALTPNFGVSGFNIVTAPQPRGSAGIAPLPQAAASSPSTAGCSTSVPVTVDTLPELRDILPLQDAVVTRSSLNKGEMVARYSNDFAVHLVASDVPGMLSIAANLAPLPRCFGPVLKVANSLNTVTGIAAIASDLRELHGSLRNPRATKLDRAMDIGHLVVGDVLSTIAGAVPLVSSLNQPLAMGCFVGGQVLGLAADLAKTVYDIQRKGQQSAA